MKQEKKKNSYVNFKIELSLKLIDFSRIFKKIQYTNRIVPDLISQFTVYILYLSTNTLLLRIHDRLFKVSKTFPFV